MPVEQRGQVIAVEHGPTGSNREEPEGSAGRRQPSRGDTSRMNREVQVRICEGLGVKLPGPTRPTLPSPASVLHGSYLGISCRRGVALGLSQSDLARKIGPVAFQQVQKYENGTDRVSASRLYLI